VFRSACFVGATFLIAAQLWADEPVPPSQPTRPSPNAMKELRAACAADVQKLCPGVQPGSGRIMQCLSEHKSEASETCKQALLKARQGSSAG
jgi:hypothetical protein